MNRTWSRIRVKVRIRVRSLPGDDKHTSHPFLKTLKKYLPTRVESIFSFNFF